MKINKIIIKNYIRFFKYNLTFYLILFFIEKILYYIDYLLL